MIKSSQIPDKRKPVFQRTVSRRNLLKVLPLGAGALLAACVAPPPAAQPAAPAEAAKATKAPAAASSDAVTLKWGMWGDAEELKAHQAVADAFTAKNPSIKVEIETAPWNDYNTKLKTLLASGDELYDVFWYAFNVQALAEQGVIENLTPFAQQSNFDLKDYWPGTLDQATYKAMCMA